MGHRAIRMAADPGGHHARQRLEGGAMSFERGRGVFVLGFAGTITSEPDLVTRVPREF
jgi:hypothetical protein